MTKENDDTVITLISKEGDKYEVPFAVAKLSKVIAEMSRDDDNEDEDEDSREVYLSTVKSHVLAKVVAYCEHYINVEPMTQIESKPFKTDKLEEMVQEWYVNFVQVDKVLLFEMVVAANYLDIRPMLELCCVAVVKLIVGKTADEIRPIFGISNPPWTAEEIAEVRAENEWAFEAKRKFEEERKKILEDKAKRDADEAAKENS
mmetsp:Transcript_12485/g.15656  ORF Transcript_12485/g.15656 Transcript_12485/m.15656 type:complete len:203 (+) Transcript_12485:97-705(+)|eukprot:CAMPEP_0172496944 /NCGR_PEP_ID=MMETSP1066-20121228/94705_1 /TAXON_ID=671091 /ORGANISM="Coscinodiscus wailesii, Strain CCMP2513" /LENGTH=202 /DNA_ID=CAMNT_0013269501 /DNA_START=97 /DNA_END=705 /DNA_ORIENTATION=-